MWTGDTGGCPVLVPMSPDIFLAAAPSFVVPGAFSAMVFLWVGLCERESFWVGLCGIESFWVGLCGIGSFWVGLCGSESSWTVIGDM